jgi:hypothetical protein
MKQIAFESMVRGLQFHAIGKGLVDNIDVGEPVKLLAEPTNPYDSNAIAIYLDRPDGHVMIGYIPKELTHKVHPLLNVEGMVALISHTQLPKFMTVAVYLEEGSAPATPTNQDDDSKPQETPDIDI